eukprot:3287637-Pyramimonas_sp.AAC.1
MGWAQWWWVRLWERSWLRNGARLCTSRWILQWVVLARWNVCLACRAQCLAAPPPTPGCWLGKRGRTDVSWSACLAPPIGRLRWLCEAPCRVYPQSMRSAYLWRARRAV